MAGTRGSIHNIFTSLLYTAAEKSSENSRGKTRTVSQDHVNADPWEQRSGENVRGVRGRECCWKVNDCCNSVTHKETAHTCT